MDKIKISKHLAQNELANALFLLTMLKHSTGTVWHLTSLCSIRLYSL